MIQRGLDESSAVLKPGKHGASPSSCYHQGSGIEDSVAIQDIIDRVSLASRALLPYGYNMLFQVPAEDIANCLFLSVKNLVQVEEGAFPPPMSRLFI